MWRTALLLALATVALGQDTCYSSDPNRYLLFGTKTAYNFVNRYSGNLHPQNIPGCQPAAIWLLNRHGVNNPEADELPALERLTHLKDTVVKNYNNDFPKKEPKICAADVTTLNNWGWNPRHNLTYAGNLASEGYKTTQELGRGWRTRYPGLFTDNPHNYLFKYTKDKLSSDSFSAFSDKVFPSLAGEIDLPQENDEKLLKPDKFCPSWSHDIGDNNETLKQRDIFESKIEWTEMLSNISYRLGFTYDLGRSMIKRVYDMCRYNKAWDVNNPSPWCAAFSREDLRRFEYAEDLETFYKYGYGSEMNQKLACPLVKDMMTFFNKHVDSKDPQQPIAQVLFSDAPALLLLTGALGARHDAVPITGDNYHTSPAQARRWSSSAAAPFNGNLAAVLYRCNPNGNFGYKNRNQIFFLQNEQPMDLEGCKVGLCEWPDVKARLGEIADKCNLDYCNGAPALNSFAALSVGLLALFVRYLA